MSRIPVIQPPERQDGVIPYAYRPRMAFAIEELAQAVYQETTLSYREAEAARIVVAHINGCLMCQGYRIAEQLPEALKKMASGEAPNTGANRGEAPDEAFYKAVAEGVRDGEIFSERERMAMEFAERISLTPIPLPYDDEFWDRLKAVYDDGEIADLTYSINCWIATGRMVHVLGLDGACMIAPVEARAAAE